LSIPTPFFFHSVPPFPYLFHPSYLSSAFIQYFSPFLSLPLSFCYLHSTCAHCFFFLIAHSASSFLLFPPIPVFSLLVPTSKSRHYFSLSCTVSPQVLRNFLSHLSYSPLYLDSLILSPLSCLSVLLSLSLSSTFIHLPFAINLSTSSLEYLLPSILSSNFAVLFPVFTLSLFL
jgi:hypothetical protein